MVKFLGMELYNAWSLGGPPLVEPPTIIINGRNYREAGKNIDFKALERQLRADESRAKTSRTKLRGQPRRH